MKDLFNRLRASPWIVIVALFVICACFPIWPAPGGGRTNMIPYVLSWFGGLAQAASAAIVGWWFVRRVLRLNISEVPEGTPRAIAGVGAALVIAAFVVGVCVAI